MQSSHNAYGPNELEEKDGVGSALPQNRPNHSGGSGRSQIWAEVEAKSSKCK